MYDKSNEPLCMWTYNSISPQSWHKTQLLCPGPTMWTYGVISPQSWHNTRNLCTFPLVVFCAIYVDLATYGLIKMELSRLSHDLGDLALSHLSRLISRLISPPAKYDKSFVPT